MFGYLLLGTLLLLAPVAAVVPYVALLVYVWLQYLAPQAMVWGMPQEFPYSQLFGALVLLGFLWQSKRVRPLGWMVALFAAYIVWINVTTHFAIGTPEEVAVKWDRTLKVLMVSFCAIFFLRGRLRIEAYLLVFVLALSYVSLGGAVKTLLTGGGGRVVTGAGASFVGDRSVVAMAMFMTIPLVLYLSRHAALFPTNRFTRLAGIGMVVACVLTAVGTQARAGLVVALVFTAVAFWRSKHKLRFVLGAAVAGAIALAVAPDAWFERMETIKTYEQDASAMGRINSWLFAIDIAMQRPLIGGGFRVFTLNVDPESGKWLDSHSYLFEILAEHGFVGLGIFLCLFGGAYVGNRRVARACRDDPALAWARDLAGALNLSLVAFAVGGLFVGVGSYSFVYDFIALSMGLRISVAQQAGATAAAPAPSGPRGRRPAPPSAAPGRRPQTGGALA